MNEKNNQLTFLTIEDEFKNPEECQTLPPLGLKIYIDGASRNNPGPAGAGVYLKRGEDVLFEQGFFIGKKTNNQAEYLALLISAYYVQQYAMPGDLILIHSDSQLLVRQMTGLYRVRDHELKRMQMMAYDWFKGYTVKYCHVYRENNQVADALANRGIDKMTTLPKKLSDLLLQQGISI